MFDSLLFLYFFTLHADQLNISLGGYHIRLNNVFAFILFLIFFLRYRTHLFRIDRPLFFSLLLLSASVLLSFVFSPFKERSFFFLGWYGITLLGYFLLPYFLILYRDPGRIFSLYIASFLAVGLFAFFQLILSGFGIHFFATQMIIGKLVRADAFAYEPSYYALYMTPFVILVNTHFLADGERPFYCLGRLTYPKIFLVNFLFFLSTATSALFAFLIYCVALPFFRDLRPRLFKFALFFGSLFSLLALIAPFLMRKFFLKFFYVGFMSHGSFFERWLGIKNAWRVFLENPFFGVGLGGYPPYLLDQALTRTTYFGNLDFSNTENPLKLLEAMNVGTEILASLGIFGMGVFLFFLIVFIHKIKQALKIDRSMSYGLLLSVIIMISALQFNQGILRSYVWVHIALAYALVERIVVSKATCEAELVSFS